MDFDLPIASGQKRDVVAVIEARPTKRRRQIGRLKASDPSSASRAPEIQELISAGLYESAYRRRSVTSLSERSPACPGVTARGVSGEDRGSY